MTLVIYDNQGQIFSQVTGNYLVPQGGVQYLEVDVPEGKRIVSVDVSATPNVPIFEDIPLSKVEMIESQVAKQQNLIDELTVQLGDALLGGAL